MAFVDDSGNFYRPQRTTTTTSAPAPAPAPSAPQNAPTPPPPPQVPDYASLIANNPYYLAQQALSQQETAALKARTGASAGRALVNLGDASLASKIGGLNVPSGTAALVDQANKAGTSVLSRLSYQHEQNTQQIPAALAARGFYRSGETGHELGQENRQYGLKQGDARQQTVDYLNGLYDQYLQAQFGIEQGNVNAYLQAYQQVMAQILAGQVPGVGPSLPNPAENPGGPNLAAGSYVPPPGSGVPDLSFLTNPTVTNAPAKTKPAPGFQVPYHVGGRY